MSLSNKIPNFSKQILSRLKENAQKSKMSARLSAGIIQNGNLINCQTNQDRSYLRGVASCSMHAEKAAINNYYGRSLKFIKNRWWILREKRKYKKS